MSNEAFLWAPDQIAFLQRRAPDRVPNEVLQTELPYYSDAPVPSLEEIGRKREELGLSQSAGGAAPSTNGSGAQAFQKAAPNGPGYKDLEKRLIEAGILVSGSEAPPPLEKKEIAVAEAPAAAAEGESPAPVLPKNNDSPQGEFKEAAEDVKPAKIPLRKMTINFKPTFVRDCKVGTTYVRVGMGPLTCVDIFDGHGPGNQFCFMEEPHSKSRTRIGLPQKTLRKENILRQLASPKVMEQIMDQLENGLSNMSRKEIPTIRVERFYKELAQSPDIRRFADFLCLFRSPSRREPVYEYGIEILRGLDMGVKMVAMEYAMTTGTDPAAALEKVHAKLNVRERERAFAPPVTAPIPPAP